MIHLILLKLKRYLPIIALSVSFFGALLIVWSTQAPGAEKGLVITWVGRRNVLSIHPTWLFWGVRLLTVGFLLQLVSELLRLIRQNTLTV